MRHDSEVACAECKVFVLFTVHHLKTDRNLCLSCARDTILPELAHAPQPRRGRRAA